MIEKLLKFGFFLLYNHLAFTYDLIAWVVSLGHWSKWRETTLQHLKPGPTLELAYGTGGLFKTMTEMGLKPVGVDLSPFMARLTSNRLRKHNLVCNITQGNAQNLPFPSNYFNNVIATFPTDYIFKATTLAEVSRVLKKSPQSAQLIVVLQGHLQGYVWLTRFIEILYILTGQKPVPEKKLTAIFAQAGFNATWHKSTVQGATATVIVLQKN